MECWLHCRECYSRYGIDIIIQFYKLLKPIFTLISFIQVLLHGSKRFSLSPNSQQSLEQGLSLQQRSVALAAAIAEVLVRCRGEQREFKVGVTFFLIAWGIAVIHWKFLVLLGKTLSFLARK